ncbi:MAG: hypothetical protein HGA45_01640 [Chloroflexales bacterium]|nr:hypothetical protein [Chloroflexales bacterium]
MASSASGGALARARGAGSSLSVPRVGGLRPYIFLALLTAVALAAAYAVRPTVRIDMGGDYDAAFLRGFNGREIDAASAAETDVYPWAPGQATLAVPGGRRGDWIATLRAAPGQPPGILDEAAVAVNGVRVDMPRRGADSLLAKIPPELSGAEQLTFSLVSPLVGGALPPRDIVAEVALAPARTYRWTTGESMIALPNLGRGAWVVELGVVTRHPGGQPVGAEIFAGDTPLASLPESGDQRQVRLLVPASAVRDGSLALTIRSAVFEDPRPLGVLLSDGVVAPAAGAGPAAAIPPLGGLALALVTVLGAFATLHLAVGGRGRRADGRAPSLLWPALGVALAALAGGWALMAHRFPSSFMLPGLAWLAAWSALLVLALRPLTRWLFRAAGMALDDEGPGAKDAGGVSGLMGGEVFLSALLIIFILSYWLKAAGALYPYFVAIDVHWHMTRAQWILGGDLPLLYGTSSPLNETTMPTAEWGANRPVIPYSPWFHMFATVFAFTPMPMDTAANMFSILVDSTRVVLIALIALKAGLSRRGALLAAATYAVTPVAYLLHSWGNIPTGLGLWLTLVCNTVIFVWWGRLRERRVMVALSALLLITFLEYTVTGVFMGLFLVVLTALVWLNGMRGGPWAALRSQLGPLWVAAGVAIALSLAIYYGQYIPPIIAQTVPYMGTVFTRGPESVGVERPPFGQYMWAFVPHLDYRIWPGDYLYYGLAIPLIFTVPGFVAMRRRPLAWVVFAAWGTVALLFMLAGYRISMVDKQLFYLLPMICVCWAIYADRIWGRWPWGRWAIIAVLLYTLYAALDQWVLRIATSPVVG